MGFGTVNTGYPVKINEPGGVAGIGEDGKIPASLLPETGGGFVEMTESIPTENRKKDTLYGHVRVDFTGTAPKD